MDVDDFNIIVSFKLYYSFNIKTTIYIFSIYIYIYMMYTVSAIERSLAKLVVMITVFSWFKVNFFIPLNSTC